MLPGPGADWTAAGRERRLYVSMPRVDKVAVIDTDTFKVTASVDAEMRVGGIEDARAVTVIHSQGNVVADGVGKQKRFLGHRAHLRAQSLMAQTDDILTVEIDVTRWDLQMTVEDIDQGALARTVRANESDLGRLVEGDRDALEDLPLLVELVQVLDLIDNALGHVGEEPIRAPRVATSDCRRIAIRRCCGHQVHGADWCRGPRRLRGADAPLTPGPR